MVALAGPVHEWLRGAPDTFATDVQQQRAAVQTTYFSGTRDSTRFASELWCELLACLHAAMTSLDVTLQSLNQH
jgi:hypothetical protein